MKTYYDGNENKKGSYRTGLESLQKEHSPRWGKMGMHTKWEQGRGGNENEGKHTGLGLDWS